MKKNILIFLIAFNLFSCKNYHAKIYHGFVSYQDNRLPPEEHTYIKNTSTTKIYEYTILVKSLIMTREEHFKDYKKYLEDKVELKGPNVKEEIRFVKVAPLSEYDLGYKEEFLGPNSFDNIVVNTYKIEDCKEIERK